MRNLAEYPIRQAEIVETLERLYKEHTEGDDLPCGDLTPSCLSLALDAVRGREHERLALEEIADAATWAGDDGKPVALPNSVRDFARRILNGWTTYPDERKCLDCGALFIGKACSCADQN